MAVPIALREDFDALALRGLAKKTRDANQSRRLLALAAIYDGGSRGQAARIGGVGLQTMRDWVLRFNARGPDGLIDGKAPGRAPKLNGAQRQELARIIESGPIPAIHGVVRWRLTDLAQWVWEEYRIRLAKQTLSRQLRAMGFRKLSARPRHHAHNEHAAEAFKKKLPRPAGADRAQQVCGRRDRGLVPGRGPHRPEEQDHAPLGQARHPAPQPPRPAYLLGLHLRRHLSQRG